MDKLEMERLRLERHRITHHPSRLMRPNLCLTEVAMEVVLWWTTVRCIAGAKIRKEASAMEPQTMP